MRRVIEEVAGRRVTDDDLRASIRRVQREPPAAAAALRHSPRDAVEAPGARVVRSHGRWRPAAARGAQRLLAAALPQIEARDLPVQDRIRVVFEAGSASSRRSTCCARSATPATSWTTTC